ncbi:MAG: leucine-rich repeat protein, partial [Eubacterium sp.]|nr:leucine-rich repeat protein [Eubacterium sp.]
CYFAVKAESDGNYLDSPLAVSPKKKSYTLKINPNYNHGSTSMAEQLIYNVSGKYVLPQTTGYAAAEGYKFVGWSLSQSGGELITSVDVNKDTTVYAIWKKYTARIGDNVYYNIDYNIDGSNLYIYGSGAMYNYTQGAPAPSPFYNNTSITSIYIAGGVTSIGDNAFYGCSNVESVYLENAMDLTKIGFNAFQNCSKLSTIDYPCNLSEDIQIINSGAFKNCSSLKEFRMPSNVKYVVANAFEGCTELRYISIPQTVTSINKDAFKGCTSLCDIFYEGSEEEWEAVSKDNNVGILNYAELHPFTSWGVPIGANAFYTVDAFNQKGTVSGKGTTYDYALNKSPLLQKPVQEITVEGSLSRIGNNLFAGLESLNTLTIENGVKTIGSGAFRECCNLSSISIPDSVTAIESYAAAWSGNLNKIYLGSGVKTIGDCAFLGNPTDRVYYNGSKELFDAITITDKESNSSLLNATFCSLTGSWGENITYHYDPEEATLTFSGTGAMNEDLKGSHQNRPWYNYRDEIRHAVVEDGITSVSTCCFMEMGITDAELPDSITKFGTSAFLRCKNLTHIVIPEKVKTIEISDFAYCTALTDVVLNDGLETVGFLAFVNCTALKNINIPESVTNIMGQSFSGCWALQDFAMPNKAKTIEFYTFYNSPNLKSVYIPKSVTEIGEGAFWECEGLSDIYYEGSASDWKKISINYANGYNDILKTVKIHYDCTSIAGASVTGVKTKTFSGKEQSQSVTVKLNGKTLKKGTDYTLSYKNNKKVGTATVTVKGIGIFSGSVKKTFKINPKGTTVSKVSSPKSKQLKVSWKKQTSSTTGYQIQYSTSSKFKSAKTVTIKKNKTTSVTIKKLKSKKKYYVRIRTYKTVDGKKYYSSWSSAKSVTTKK